MEDFLPLELDSTDAVLGMQWLGSLGCMEVNWKLLTMKFRMGETWMTLRGDQRLNKSAVSLRAMMKALLNEGQGVSIEMEHPAERGALMGKEKELPAGVSKLMQQHKKVITETRELPPTQGMDHAITLKARTDPISVWPFRYPHF